MKVTVVNFSDSRGGAAIACRKMVTTIAALSGISIRFVVAEKLLNDELSLGPSKFQGGVHFIQRLLCFFIIKLQFSRNKSKHSLNLFSAPNVLKELKQDADVLHLHWVNNETLSLKILNVILSECRFKKVVFTLHDEWFFLGSEHISQHNSTRFKDGYLTCNKDSFGLDVDRFVFLKKIELQPFFMNNNVVFTVPSKYMLKKAKSSYLLSGANIRLLPNIIDTFIFTRREKHACRIKFGLDPDAFVLLFGAVGGGDRLKGIDLLVDTLKTLHRSKQLGKIVLVTFGGKKVGNYSIDGYQAFGLGQIRERYTMAEVFSCADLTLVPSRRESFGQVAAESLSCETPVVAFDNSGISDIVQHEHSGYLVRAFDTDMMADFVVRFLNLSNSERQKMGRNGRDFVVNNFSEQVVSSEWLDLYKND